MKAKLVLHGIAMVSMLALAGACNKKSDPKAANAAAATDYRQEMRNLITEISDFTRKQKPGFLIVPQDGLHLLTNNGTPTGQPYPSFLAAIDGVGQEEINYGYDNQDDVATPTSVKNEYNNFAKLYKQNGKQVLVIDYCTTTSKINNAYAANAANGFISYVATHRVLDNIATTTPYGVNNRNIDKLDSAKNFLFLINTVKYNSKTALLNALRATNFDVLVIDAWYESVDDPITPADINLLKTKANGGRRLVLSYMSIGQAEDYRWYWNPAWQTNPPDWLVPAEDSSWAGNYNVKYWLSGWKALMYGNSDSYAQRILSGGFDGAYLDLYNLQYWLE